MQAKMRTSIVRSGGSAGLAACVFLGVSCESVSRTVERTGEGVVALFDGQENTPRGDGEFAAHRGAPQRVTHANAEGWTTSTIDEIEQLQVRQKEPVWCWAACAEMIYRYEGRDDLTQAEIAARIHGFSDTLPEGEREEHVRTAVQHEVILALAIDDDREEKMAEGQYAAFSQAVSRGDVDLEVISMEEFLGTVAESYGEHLNPNFMVESIIAGFPLVAGLFDPEFEMGHAYVVHGVRYQRADEAAQANELVRLAPRMSDSVTVRTATEFVPRYRLAEVILIDPMTGERTTRSFDAFAESVRFLMNRPKALEIVERLSKPVRMN